MLFINFEGAGWMFPFYFGVAQYFKEHIDINSDNIKIGGVSAGAVTALMLILDNNFHDIYLKAISKYNEAKYNPFKMKECLNDILLEYIPDNNEIIKKCNGKLLIGVCKIDLANLLVKSHIIKDYGNKNACIDIIKASCHIPIISGISPYYINGEGYFDGDLTGISYNEPCKNRIDISIRYGENSIHPGIKLPEIWAYYPSDPFILKNLFNLGYHRANQFLCENLEIIKPYIKKNYPIKSFNNNIIQEIYEIINYCKKNNTVCKIRSPLQTLLYIFPKQLGLFIFLWFTCKRLSPLWKKVFAYIYSKMLKRKK